MLLPPLFDLGFLRGIRWAAYIALGITVLVFAESCAEAAFA